MKVLDYDEWSPVEPNGTPRRISEPTSNWLHFGAKGKAWDLDTAIGHARYHIKTKGWLTVGYSALVVLYPEPALLLGRVLRRGAHTQGHNRTGAGICVPGNVTHVPDEGLDALAEALRIGAREGWWPDEFTGGHRDVANKPCPGEPLYIRIPEINRRARSKTKPEEDDMPSKEEVRDALLNADVGGKPLRNRIHDADVRSQQNQRTLDELRAAFSDQDGGLRDYERDGRVVREALRAIAVKLGLATEHDPPDRVDA